MANIGYDEVSDPNSPLAKAVNKALGTQYNDSLFDETPQGPTKFEYSGVEPTRASEIIDLYLSMQPERPTTFKFESWLLGVAVGTVSLAIVVILTVLGAG